MGNLDICDDCNGTGRSGDPARSICATCGGSGEKTAPAVKAPAAPVKK